MGKLDGKVVVVTGASRGIGAEISARFAAEGGRIVCAARTVREGDHPLEGSLEKTVADIKEAGGEATAVAVNLARPEECERLIEEAQELYGPVDVLVNNAALTYFIPVKDFPTSRWIRSWEVNFHAPFILSRTALGQMIPRRSGSIINISSGAAVGPGRGPYGDSAGIAEAPATGRKGGPGTLHPGPGQRGVRVRDFGYLRFSFAGGPHSRHRVPQLGNRYGRPQGRANVRNGRCRPAAGHRAP